MRIELERSGGFAGIRRTSRVEEGALAPEDEERLRAALEAAGFFELPPTPRGGGGARGADRFAWRLRAEDGERANEVRFDEASATDELRAVVELVEELAK